MHVHMRMQACMHARTHVSAHLCARTRTQAPMHTHTRTHRTVITIYTSVCMQHDTFLQAQMAAAVSHPYAMGLLGVEMNTGEKQIREG